MLTRPLVTFFVILCILTFSCDNKSNQESEAVKEVRSDSVVIAESDSLANAYFQADNNNRTSYVSSLERAVSLRESRLQDQKLFEWQNSLGQQYFRDFKYQLADDQFDKARLLANRLGLTSDALIEVLITQAEAKKGMRDYLTARSMIFEALKIMEHLPATDNKRIRAYTVLGSISYETGDYDEALRILENQLNAAVAVKNSNRMSQLYLNQSNIFGAKKDYKSALSALNRSLAVEFSSKKRDTSRIATRYMSKASVFRQLSQLDSARYYYYKSIATRAKMKERKTTRTFGAYFALADFFDNEGQYDSAVAYFQRSLCELVDNFNDRNWQKNPSPQIEEVDENLILGLVKKATSLENSFGGSQHDLSRLKASLATFLLADSVYSIYRRYAVFDDAVLNQMQMLPIDYGTITSICFRLHELTGEQKYLESAFHAMETSRAALVQEALHRNRQIFQSPDSTGQLLIRHNRLLKSRASTLLAMNASSKKFSIDSMTEVLLKITDDESMLQKEIARLAPAYYNARFRVNKSSLSDIMDFARERNITVIEYKWSTDKLYALNATGKGFSTTVVSLDSEFVSNLDFYRRSISSLSVERMSKEYHRRFIKAGYSLFQRLLDGIDADGTPLVICPDGPLLNFPFETLLTASGDTTSVNYQLPYMIKTRAVGYAQSLGLLLEGEDASREGTRVAAFAYGAGNSESSLQGSEKELAMLQDQIGTRGNFFFEGDEASETNFKNSASNVDVLHIALHGEADTVNALQSRIIFRTPGSQDEDGSLFAHELYDFDLHNLKLAVLTACESGLGKFQTGEGNMSIARGFAFAGCQSIVMSLWKVDDQTSAMLMKSYYSSALNGNDLSESIRSSKLGYLTQADELSSYPFYWGGLVHIGDSRPIQSNSRWIESVVSIGITIGVFVSYRLFRKRRWKHISATIF